MEYVLMCTKSQQVHYVCLTSTRAVKKVTNLSQASRFMSQTEAKRLRDHASKKLRKYKIRSIAEATTESRTIQEKQQIKRKAIPASVRAKYTISRKAIVQSVGSSFHVMHIRLITSFHCQRVEQMKNQIYNVLVLYAIA